MRILFMGTPLFAKVCLDELLNETGKAAQLEILGVVTQPDRPRGRGLILQPSEVKVLALEHQLPIWQPEDISQTDFLNLFRQLDPDLVIVVAFGQKIPSAVLFEPRYGCINVHGSILPRYRGANPIQCCLLNGDQTTGITTIHMDEGWDTGDMIYQEETGIDPEENFEELYLRLAKLGGKVLLKTIIDVSANKAPRIKQDPALATKAPKLKPGQQLIDWREPAVKIHNRVRAFAPRPGAETFLDQERLKIVKTKPIVDDFNVKASPGEIISIDNKYGVLVATGDYPISISQVQPLGKKVMTGLEFSNGRRLKEGMQFGQPV